MQGIEGVFITLMVEKKESLVMSSETTALLGSIRQWLLVIVFLLGVGVLTLAHIGYVQNNTQMLFWQSLVFSVSGVLGGLIATIAGIKLLGSYSSSSPDGHPTE
ncbi:hypothetical protein C443_03484 [Haloarcula argentinensis DSM 12282]|nr:hypothetical protein C443_03484 [Haloarcula argentinensis DSM 12282]